MTMHKVRSVSSAVGFATLEKNTKILGITQIALICLTMTALFLPVAAAQYGGTLYGVRGIDIVFGAAIPGDRWGVVPQTSAAFTALAMALGVVSSFIKNRDKAAFLPTLCMAIAAGLWGLMVLGANESDAQLDPLVDALFNKQLQYGYYIILLLMLISIAVGVLRILSRRKLRVDLVRSRWVYVMALPVLVYVLIFFYYPIYGTLLAFKDYSPRLGILGSPWVGFDNFVGFFNSIYFWRLIRNTLLISLYQLIFGFSAPVIFALLLNEVRSNKFKRVVQTATYLPHFVSLVVVCGLLTVFLQREGLFNQVFEMLGKDPATSVNYLGDPKYFRFIYVLSGIWQSFGWSSIVYFAAITNIDAELYEAAEVDGAKRFRKMWSVTLPGIAPTIIIMFIMALGGLMNVGHEKIILLYNPQTYQTADVISSFVYRRGLIENDYGFATAVGLFNTVISLTLVTIANKVSRHVSETSLW